MGKKISLIRFRDPDGGLDSLFASLFPSEGGAGFETIRTIDRDPEGEAGKLTDRETARLGEALRENEMRPVWIVLDHPDLKPSDVAAISADIEEDPERIAALALRVPVPEGESVVHRALRGLVEKSTLPRVMVWYLPAGALGCLREDQMFASVFPLRWLIGCRCAGKKACLRVRRKNWNRTYRSQKFSFPALLWYYFHRLVRYSTASLFSVLLDYVVFMTVLFFGAPSLAALIVGRAFSMAVNFTLLRKFVYRDRPELARAWLRYLGLTLFSSAAAFFAIETLRRVVPLPVVIVKALVETTLFFFNYTMSREWVFRKKSEVDG